MLKLRQNEILPKGVKFIADSFAVRALTVLDLSTNAIEDDGLYFLTTASYLSNLNKLYVNDCGLTSVAAKHLNKSRFLGKLRALQIGKN